MSWGSIRTYPGKLTDDVSPKYYGVSYPMQGANVMKKPTLYNLEITLTCPRCKKECPMYGFEPGKSKLLDSINNAWVNHQSGELCNPPGCERCGGTDSDFSHGKHMGRDDCIKHLRKLVVDLYQRLPPATSTITFQNVDTPVSNT